MNGPGNRGTDRRLPETLPVRSALRYALGVLTGAVFVFLLYTGSLLALDRTGHLPPPPLSNSICVDEKLKFLREHHDISPTLLITGSSVAWRGVDTALLQSELPGERAFNGALCGQKVNQTARTTDWFLKHYPGIRTIVMLAVPQDFTQCRVTPSASFPVAETDDYVFGKETTSLPLKFYLEFFDPVSLQHNARRIAALRRGELPLDTLASTPTGDGPVDTEISRSDLGAGALPPYDPACFSALGQMEQTAGDSGRHFVVVILPLKREWERRYDPDHRRRAELMADMKPDLVRTHGQEIDLEDRLSLPEAAFTDATHVRWSAVPAITEVLGDVLRSGAGAPAGDRG